MTSFNPTFTVVEAAWKDFTTDYYKFQRNEVVCWRICARLKHYIEIPIYNEIKNLLTKIQTSKDDTDIKGIKKYHKVLLHKFKIFRDSFKKFIDQLYIQCCY